MRRLHSIHYICLSILTCVATGIAGGNTVDPNRTEVVIIGVFHAYHQKNPNYTQQILRDMHKEQKTVTLKEYWQL